MLLSNLVAKEPYIGVNHFQRRVPQNLLEQNGSPPFRIYFCHRVSEGMRRYANDSDSGHFSVIRNPILDAADMQWPIFQRNE